MPPPPYLQQSDGDVLLSVKAVPGASRDQIAGAVGERLKVRIAAPPEGGRANKAILALLADALGVKKSGLAIESGRTSPEKTIRITDARIADVAAKLDS